MKEEGGGMQYMSPLVKQDLAKLDKDGESRRVAMDSLKHCVENLEPASVPRFLAQVAESKEAGGGGSRSYAISLYEEVARVHGKLIISQLPRVMATVMRSLSASGSSPQQLHQACAKVVSALVRYSIDSNTSMAEAEEVVRVVGHPLVEAIAGKLEPVAAGAATCMQSLVESEKWKYAPACLVSEVCQRTTAALREKATCTVAHMQLVCSLAIIAPSALSMYGAELLHSGEEILKASLTSWKHRKCAAKMLQAVVSVVDRTVLASELSSTVQVLESFRLDKMPHVRTAVWEALQTAKIVTTDDNCNQDNDREGSLGTGSRLTPHWRSFWGSHRSLSSSITESETSLRSSSPSCSGNGFNGKMRQTPLFPARGQVHAQESMARTSLTFTMDDDPDSSVCNSDVKKNVPSQDSELVSDAVWGGKSPPLGSIDSAAHVPIYEAEMDFQEQRDMHPQKDSKPSLPSLSVCQDSVKGRIVLNVSPIESRIMQQFREAKGDLMVEDEVIISGKAGFAQTELDEGNCGNHENRLEGSLMTRVPELGTRFATQSPESMLLSGCVQSASGSCQSMVSNSRTSGDSAICSMEGGIWDCPSSTQDLESGVVDRRKLHLKHNSLQGGAKANSRVGYVKQGLTHTPSKHLAHVSKNAEDGLSVLKPRLLITAEDFQPFATPRKLVRSLQSDLGSPLSDSNVINQDSQPSEGVISGLGCLYGDADMELETSSDEGWSVRENPIASEESFQTEISSEGETKRRQTSIHKAFASSVNGSTPRAASPMPAVPCKTCSLDRGLDYPRTPNHEPGSSKGDNIGTYRLTPKSLRHYPEKAVAKHTCESCIELQKSVTGMGDILNSDDTRSSVTMVTVPRRMLHEQVDECCTCGRACAASATGSATEWDQGSRDNEGVSTLVSSTGMEESCWNERLGQNSIVGSVWKSLIRMSHYAEIFLGGSVVVILALFISMVVARALVAQPDYYPVPT